MDELQEELDSKNKELQALLDSTVRSVNPRPHPTHAPDMPPAPRRSNGFGACSSHGHGADQFYAYQL